MDYSWTCRSCGKQHNQLPLDFAVRAPDHWFQLPEAERARAHLDTDVCRIEDDIFVRGCLEVPIHGHTQKFVWGLWVSVSKDSFRRILELWDAAEIVDEPPRFGWLCNSLSLYPSTVGLKTHLHMRGGNTRPLIELEPTDHPLAIEQRAGISLHRVEELVAALLPRH
jgi:hypothetical protein